MCIRDRIQAAEADVVCPAVTTEDPDGLLGDELLALQDLSGLGAAAHPQIAGDGVDLEHLSLIHI